MTHVLIERMGWVLIHSLWQFALLSLLSGVVALALSRRSAQSRYLFHVITMAGFVVSSIATWSLVRVESPSLIAQSDVTDARQLEDAALQELRPTLGESRDDAMADQRIVTGEYLIQMNAPGSGDEAVPEFVSASPNRALTFSERIRSLLRPWLSWIVVSWSLGVVLLSMRPLIGWHMLRRLRQRGVSAPTDEIRAALFRVATQMGLRRAVDVMLSSVAQVPVVVGYVRPVILLPVAFALSVPLSQLEAILAHELAHVRRHDFVLNLLQTLIETVFFYHPAVWWLSHRIRVEREHCCDDLAVSILKDRIEYGRALVSVEELRGRSTVLAMSAADGSLLSRVQRIVGGVSDRSDLNPRWPVVIVGLAMLGLLLKLTVGSSDSTMAANFPLESQGDESTRPDDSVSSNSDATTATFGETKYIAELPDGRSIEFVGMTKNTRPASEGWRPDGSPIGEIGVWPSTILLHNKNTSAAYNPEEPHPDPDEDAVDLLFRFRGLRSQPSIKFDLPSNGSSFHHLPVKDPYELRVSTRLRGEPPPGATWSPPDGVVRIGLTDEPWGKWLQIDERGQVLNPLTDEDLYRSHYERIQIVRVEPHERTPDKKALMLRQPKNRYELYDFEMRGIDAEEKTQWVLEQQSTGAPDPEMTEQLWGLAFPETKTLVRYEFRLRPNRYWGTFENVSFVPGASTEIKIKVEAIPVSLSESTVAPPKKALGDVNGDAPADPMERMVSLNASGLPVKDALEKIARDAGLGIQIDLNALKQVDFDAERPVTLDVQGVPFKAALEKLIPWDDNPQIVREIRQGKLIVTTLEESLVRTASRLPEWMRPLQQKGLSVYLNEKDEVESVTLSGDVTEELLERVASLPHLTKLELSAAKLQSTSILKHLSGMPKLESFSAAQVTSQDVELGDDVIRSLLPVKSLRALSLNECGTTNAGAKLLEEMPQLTSLNLYQEGKLTDEALKSIRRLSQLKSLSMISYVGTQRLGWMRFSAEGTRLLSRLKRLEILNLVGHEVTAETLELPNLVTLGLGHENIGDDVAAKVAELQSLRNLELNYCRISDTGMKGIAALPNLQRLELSSLTITDAGLAPLGNSQQLRHVTLRAVNASDATLRQFARIKTLNRLDLYGGGAGGLGRGPGYTINGLVELKSLPDFRTLWMTNMTLGAGSYPQLKELPRLTELTMVMCDISEGEVELLETALPQARITHLTGGGSWLPKKEKRRLLAPAVAKPQATDNLEKPSQVTAEEKSTKELEPEEGDDPGQKNRDQAHTKPGSQKLDGSSDQPVGKSSIVIKYDIPGAEQTGKIHVRCVDENREIGERAQGRGRMAWIEVENGSELRIENMEADKYVVSRLRTVPLIKDSRRGPHFSDLYFLDETYVQLWNDDVTTVRMMRPGGKSISGKVLGIKEQGLANAVVYVNSQRPKELSELLAPTKGLVDVVPTDADGNFKTEPLSPGTYVLTAVIYTAKDLHNITRSDVENVNYWGEATVTILGDVPTQPLKIELFAVNKTPPSRNVEFERVVDFHAGKTSDQNNHGNSPNSPFQKQNRPETKADSKQQSDKKITVIVRNGNDVASELRDRVSQESRIVNLPQGFAYPFVRIDTIVVQADPQRPGHVIARVKFLKEADEDRRIVMTVKGLDEAGKILLHTWDVIADPRTGKPGTSLVATRLEGATSLFSTSRANLLQSVLSELHTVEIIFTEVKLHDLRHMPENPSKTNLRITSPDVDGKFTVKFDNPQDDAESERWDLDAKKHQVIFQVAVNDPQGRLTNKIFQQLAAQPHGGYRVDVQVPSKSFEYSTVSVTFVTIQPDHDVWVSDFFHKGKKTNYHGIWSSDGGLLVRTALDGGPYALTSRNR